VFLFPLHGEKDGDLAFILTNNRSQQCPTLMDSRDEIMEHFQKLKMETEVWKQIRNILNMKNET